MSNIQINDTALHISRGPIKIATIYDEEWIPPERIGDPEEIIEKLKNSRYGVDIFTFTQRLPETEPKYSYPMEWNNLAVVPITTFDDWWTKRLPQVTRKNVRRSVKKGCTVRVTEYDDEFVKGIQSIYNETPIRQGRKFWHYGKDFETVKRENATYLENSDFIGAYNKDELIGFIKIVYVGKCATIMQILSKVAHQDKRPTNALLAKGVELCVQKKSDYFIYGKYSYGKRTWAPVIEFKERNGFEKVEIPKYNVPLSAIGKFALRNDLHHGMIGLIPEPVLNYLIDIRAKWLEKKYASKETGKDSDD